MCMSLSTCSLVKGKNYRNVILQEYLHVFMLSLLKKPLHVYILPLYAHLHLLFFLISMIIFEDL